MQSETDYHRQLRSIGQSLEAQRINVFELTCGDESIQVKGQPDKEASLLAALLNWQKQRRSAGVNSPLLFTYEDIDQLDRQGRGRRSQSNRLPDFHSLPNMLRTVGAYLDSKGSRLMELHKRQLSLTILSQDHRGHPQFEDRTIASFHDLFIRLHGRRGKPRN